MKVLNVRNVHEALPIALKFLDQCGVERESRNGNVLVSPFPVTTVYENPLENVIFWPDRDANPFFHLYEALYMLQGRDEVAPLARYAANVAQYSDDGKTFWGGYGKRWRDHFSLEGIPGFYNGEKDQLPIIIERLTENPDDRRCVLQMWDAECDLDSSSRDVPCNTITTFQRGLDGALNLVVFCRSNDIIWGAYGANAVQFSILLEYMALKIGCPVGTYSQISVNFHAYLNTYEQCKRIRPDRVNFIENPYIDRRVHHISMTENIDKEISLLLEEADDHFERNFYPDDPWSRMVYCVLRAHDVYKKNVGEDKYRKSLNILMSADQQADWIVASREWLQRRYTTWKIKQIIGGELSHQ